VPETVPKPPGTARAQGLTAPPPSPAESLRAFIEFCDGFGLTSPRAVTEAIIETYLATFTARGLKPRTVSRALYAIRSLFKYLLREQVIDRDPAATSYGPRVPKSLPVYLTIPEWTRVLRKLRADPTLLGQRDYAIIGLFLYSGLRVAELAPLRLDQVRLEAGWLRVRGKGSKEREIPIASAIAPALRTTWPRCGPGCWATTSPATRTCSSPRRPAGPRARGDAFGRAISGARSRRGRSIASSCSGSAPILGRAVSPHKLRHWPSHRLLHRSRSTP